MAKAPPKPAASSGGRRLRPRRAKPLRPKLPSRRDSHEVVESIVLAATDILAKEGMDGLTTNRIAERAGVGVASVYRYFKDKIAIVAEIDLRNRRENTRLLVEACRAGVDNNSDSDSDSDSASDSASDSDDEDDTEKKSLAKLSAITRTILSGFLDTRDGRSRIRKTLMTEVPVSWIAQSAGESWSQALDAIAQTVSSLRPDLSKDEVERRTFFAMHAVQGVVTGQLVFPAPIEVTQDEAVAYVERLIVPFLLAPNDRTD